MNPILKSQIVRLVGRIINRVTKRLVDDGFDVELMGTRILATLLSMQLARGRQTFITDRECSITDVIEDANFFGLLTEQRSVHSNIKSMRAAFARAKITTKTEDYATALYPELIDIVFGIGEG